MFPDFPYTNAHQLNLDWILERLAKTVLTVNETEPDETGNINLPTVSGVTSVCGIGADGSGNVNLGPKDVNALPKTDINPTNIYIDKLNGDDTNSGEAGFPKKTIGSALYTIRTSRCQASVIIHIAGGIYNEGLVTDGIASNIVIYLDGPVTINYLIVNRGYLAILGSAVNALTVKYNGDVPPTGNRMITVYRAGTLVLDCGLSVDLTNAAGVECIVLAENATLHCSQTGYLEIINNPAVYDFRVQTESSLSVSGASTIQTTSADPKILADHAIIRGAAFADYTIEGTALTI